MKNRRILWLALCLALMASLIAPVVLPAGDGAVYSAKAATTVKLNKTKATVYNGQTLQLKLSGTKSKVNWSSSNRKVATVDKNGKVTAKKAGSATITAKVGKNRYTCQLTVKSPLSTKTKALSVKAGASTKADITYALKGQVKCKSSDTKIATCKIKAKGNGYVLTVTGKKAGKATVTVSNTRTKDVLKLSVTVTAKEASQRLELSSYYGKKLSALNAVLDNKLVRKNDEICSNGVIEVVAYEDEEDPIIWRIEMNITESASQYQMAGVYYGMSLAEAKKTLKNNKWDEDCDYGGSIEYWQDDGKGEGRILGLNYKGNKITWIGVYS